MNSLRKHEKKIWAHKLISAHTDMCEKEERKFNLFRLDASNVFKK